MAIFRAPLEELNARSQDAVIDPGPTWPKRYERAFRRLDPLGTHPADIGDLADEIADRWLRRAARLGDEVLFLTRLHALPDSRTS